MLSNLTHACLVVLASLAVILGLNWLDAYHPSGLSNFALDGLDWATGRDTTWPRSDNRQPRWRDCSAPRWRDYPRCHGGR